MFITDNDDKSMQFTMYRTHFDFEFPSTHYTLKEHQ